MILSQFEGDKLHTTLRGAIGTIVLDLPALRDWDDGIFSPPSEMKNKVAAREPAFRQEFITLCRALRRWLIAPGIRVGNHS